ncbi:hypothetical protein [Streptomyces sp. AA1529]|uniref:hypothetical protein n=1 Tax=Streptomyces sp. AA1529 TaxID=1203257 RepID=UPI000374F6A0|nr:hypothetical protein [Streptomyces sp. AA1529]
MLEDPLFSVAVLEYQIATGRVRNSCMEPARLGTAMVAVALEVEGGPDAEREVEGEGFCNLLHGHRGSHYTMVRELGEGHAVWMQWRRNLARLLVMRDCEEKSANGGDICYLFLGHREPHSWDWAR